jgi:hypothetical protein
MASAIPTTIPQVMAFPTIFFQSTEPCSRAIAVLATRKLEAIFHCIAIMSWFISTLQPPHAPEFRLARNAINILIETENHFQFQLTY